MDGVGEGTRKSKAKSSKRGSRITVWTQCVSIHVDESSCASSVVVGRSVESIR